MINNIDRTYGHVDMATGDHAPHVTRTYFVFTRLDDGGGREEWKMQLRMPCAVDEALGQSDWEFVLRSLDTRRNGKYSIVEMMILSAKILGISPRSVQAKIGEVVANNLYRVYCQKRIANGDKAWLRPSSMQTGGGK